MTTDTPKSFTDIFADISSESPEDFLQLPISDTTRLLVRNDLHKSLLKSNANLRRTFDFTPNMLKASQELFEIGQNTEESIYRYHSSSTRDYLETVLTFILFLTDPKLSSDSILFRILINIDIDDLYVDPISPDFLFTELFYSKSDPYMKQLIFSQILKQINSQLPKLAYDYQHQQPVSSLTVLKYTYPKQLKTAMENYRKRNFFEIIDNLKSDISPSSLMFSHNDNGDLTSEDDSAGYSSVSDSPVSRTHSISSQNSESDASIGFHTIFQEQDSDSESANSPSESDAPASIHRLFESEDESSENDTTDSDKEANIHETENDISDDESDTQSVLSMASTHSSSPSLISITEKFKNTKRPKTESNTKPLSEIFEDETKSVNSPDKTEQHVETDVDSGSDSNSVENISDIDEDSIEADFDEDAVSTRSKSPVSSTSSHKSARSVASKSGYKTPSIYSKSSMSIQSLRSSQISDGNDESVYNTEDMKCTQCKQIVFLTNYKTPVVNKAKKELTIERFCSNECMEEWTPKR